MKRRDFFVAAGALGVAGSQSVFAAEQTEGKQNVRKYIELRTYTVKNAEKKEILIQTLDKAYIPALNRLGIKPVGVFWTNKEINENKGDFDLNVFMLMAHDSPESFLQSGAKLLQDAAFLKAAAPILDAPMKDPIYTELKSSLMYGFEKCPAIEVPTLGKDRVLQMRFYRSYNLERNAAKVHMFDHGGELPLFRKSGMPPVFFGDTIIGDFQPNLTYMLSFENEEARKLGWKTFVSSDEWKDISTRDMYKDTAHQITNILLRPSPGSQI